MMFVIIYTFYADNLKIYFKIRKADDWKWQHDINSVKNLVNGIKFCSGKTTIIYFTH